MKNNSLRCAIYIRVSTEEQHLNGLSLPAQKEALLDYAKKNHLILDDIAYDESLIDELTEANPQNYITQISVKFKKEL